MVAVGEDLAAAIHFVIQRARDANAQTLHAPRQVGFIPGLGNQMQVVLLDGKLRHPEAITVAACDERPPDDLV